jgi:MFS family permease
MMQPSPPPSPSHRSALLTVFLVVFIDLLGFGIVLPLLPLYATELLVPLYPGADNAVWRGVLLGLLMSSFSAMQFVFAPLWGRVSDRVGRRPVLLLGLAGSTAFYGLFGIASEIGLDEGGWPALGLILVFVSRLGAGVAGATIGTAQAVIADTTAPERRAHGMALIGAAFGIGFTFGPLLGFASLYLPLAGAPGYLAAGLSLGALLFGLRRLPETRQVSSTQGLRRRIFDWQGFQRVLHTPTVGLLVVTFFLATFAFGGLESTLALVNRLLLTGQDLSRAEGMEHLTREEARTTDRINFLIFAYVGLVLMLIQGLIYRRLVHRVGEVPFLRAGLVFMTLGLLGAVAVLASRTSLDQGPLLACGLGVMTLAVIGFALLTPSVQALISRRSDPDRQGEVLGVNQSASALARILGPLVGLSLFYVLPSHILPYAFGAALLVGVFVLSLRIRHSSFVIGHSSAKTTPGDLA